MVSVALHAASRTAVKINIKDKFLRRIEDLLHCLVNVVRRVRFVNVSITLRNVIVAAPNRSPVYDGIAGADSVGEGN